MNDKKIDLTEEDFSFVCPIKSEDMIEVDGGYHCDECDKKVHDVSNMTEKEYVTFLDKEKNPCVSFKKIVTVSIALSLAACADSNLKRTKGKIRVRDRNQTYIPPKSLFGNDSNASISIEGKPIPKHMFNNNHKSSKNEDNQTINIQTKVTKEFMRDTVCPPENKNNAKH